MVKIMVYYAIRTMLMRADITYMKYILSSLVALAVAFMLVPAETFASVPSNTLGRVLLQVEQRGEAWYVDPITASRYYLKNGPVAYEALRTFGLGITNEDLSGVPIGYDARLDVGYDSDGDGLSDRFEQSIHTNPYAIDTDSDGHGDGVEIMSGYNPLGSSTVPANNALVNRLKGRILLQVEDRGEAWYVNPVDGKRYYMTNGDSAYTIMRFLSLGITDRDLQKIPLHRVEQSVFDCDLWDFECLAGHLLAGNAVEFNERAESLDLMFYKITPYFQVSWSVNTYYVHGWVVVDMDMNTLREFAISFGMTEEEFDSSIAQQEIELPIVATADCRLDYAEASILHEKAREYIDDPDMFYDDVDNQTVDPVIVDVLEKNCSYTVE